MDLKARLESDLVASLKSKEKERLSVIRMILSDVKNAEIKEKGSLSEEALLSLLSRSAKQRKDSIQQFQKGGREDLVAKETKELELLLEYLPEQLSQEEMRDIVEKAIASTGASSMKEMGSVMKQVMAEVSGRADGKEVQQIVRELLSG
jgi:hypothetical protein